MRSLLTFFSVLVLNGCALIPAQNEIVEETAPAENPKPVVTVNGLQTSTNYTVSGDAVYPFLNITADADALEAAQIDNTPLDLWQRIRNGFALEEHAHKRIDKQLDWYIRHPAYMQRVAERAQPYLYYIVETLENNDIPGEIALLPIVESAFQPFAYSHGRASGIWQFIPSTGRRYGLKQNWWYDGRRDVYAATQAAVKLLNNLQKQFNGDWLLALAAYNSGEGTVHRAIRRNRRRGKPTDFWSLKLPRETRAYVPKLLALKKLIGDPDTYGLELDAMANLPYFERVKVDTQIDLAKAAELADMKLDALYQLNPGYNRWATDPDSPAYLLVPQEKAEAFRENLSTLPIDDRIKWVRHKIRPGETLSSIAQKYHTSIRSIKKVNRIRGTRLRAGKSLTIPVASRSLRNYRLSATQRKNKLQNIPRKGIKVTHIVQMGDTLWNLAQQHNVGVRQLAKWNGMAPRDPLMPGQRLIIWSRTGKQVSHNDPGELFIPPQRTITKRIGYRVRRGDSLARISQRFRVSIAQLRRWNSIPKGSYLQPGQRLTLYVDVTKQSS